MGNLVFDNLINGDKINLTENGEHVKTEMRTLEVLNSYSANIENNLEIL